MKFKIEIILLSLLLVRDKAPSTGSTSVRFEIKQPQRDKTRMETLTNIVI